VAQEVAGDSAAAQENWRQARTELDRRDTLDSYREAYEQRIGKSVATGVLEYATDLPQALSELARVVRRGGRVVVSFPAFASPRSLGRRYPIAVRQLSILYTKRRKFSAA